MLHPIPIPLIFIQNRLQLNRDPGLKVDNRATILVLKGENHESSSCYYNRYV